MSHSSEHLLIIIDSDNVEVSYHVVTVDGTQLREEKDQNQCPARRRADKYWPDGQLWLVL